MSQSYPKMTDEFYRIFLDGLNDTASVTTSPLLAYELIRKTMNEEQRMAGIVSLIGLTDTLATTMGKSITGKIPIVGSGVAAFDLTSNFKEAEVFYDKNKFLSDKLILEAISSTTGAVAAAVAITAPLVVPLALAATLVGVSTAMVGLMDEQTGNQLENSSAIFDALQAQQTELNNLYNQYGPLGEEHRKLITMMNSLVVAGMKNGIVEPLFEQIEQYGDHIDEVLTELSQVHNRQLELAAGDNAYVPESLFDFLSENITSLLGLFDEHIRILGEELFDIDLQTHDFFQSALDFVFRRDPLVLDLDGDGIETTAADGIVLFDHNANGQQTATGWIAADDGLLVLDRNGNGLIDNGRELFGDNTLKNNGELATNGFDALADLDSNQDGRVDSADTVFADLRIWQDKNQDGISQADELASLDALNIQSIGTASQNISQNLGHNNQAIASGHFTFADGSTSTAGAAASLNLAVNNFHREFSDKIAIPEQLQNLPDMKGSGDVRDLKQAAALSTTLAERLADLQPGEYKSGATGATGCADRCLGGNSKL